MTDDLVKRLREVKDWWREPGRTAEQAADRIEKQQEYIKAYQDQTNILLARVEQLEAELAEKMKTKC